jgi:small basic protein
VAIRLNTAVWLLLLTIVFSVLVTANGAGYRYGVSDQAFYIPAIELAQTPALFPRDRVLLAPQAQLTVLDEAIAGLRAGSGTSLESLFFIGYLLTVALFAAGVALIGDRLYVSRWSTAALLMALTLRHRIARTGVNTFESAFHPRVLTFALGLLAVGLFLRGRRIAAMMLALLACLVHPTTGAWFVLWMTVAWAVEAWPSRAGRRIVVGVAPLAAVIGVGVVASGALADRLTVMDAPWLAAFASRDYLFPFDDWKVGTWLTHLLPALVIAAVWQWRRRLGLATTHEHAVVIGCLALLLAFLVSMPLVEARIALAVQLQTSRVLWQIELLATAYVVWTITESPWLRMLAARRGAVAATLLAVLSLARGYYILRIEHDHRLVAVHLPASDWRRMGDWVSANTSIQAHLLADPDHVWTYGSSLRVSAKRDVALEAVKDAAIAIYSRDGASRVTDRRSAIGDFHALTEARAEALADTYALDYLLTERSLRLPLVHAEGPLKLYRLSP